MRRKRPQFKEEPLEEPLTKRNNMAESDRSTESPSAMEAPSFFPIFGFQPNPRFSELLSQLNNPGLQVFALQELSEVLSMATGNV